jgi:hypothetical protein
MARKRKSEEFAPEAEPISEDIVRAASEFSDGYQQALADVHGKLKTLYTGRSMDAYLNDFWLWIDGITVAKPEAEE